MSRLTATWRLLRGGNARARLAAARDGQAAVRLSVGSAALSTGVLEALASGARSDESVAATTGATDLPLLRAWLRVLEAYGWLRTDGAGRWELTPSGHALLDDDALRGVYEAFPGWHTGVYRSLPDQLAGGPSRTDIVDSGAAIARLSQAQEPVVSELLRGLLAEERPARVLDIGCGTGRYLLEMLRTAPAALGVGVEMDAAAADLAERAIGASGLGDRARLVRGELTHLVRSGDLDGGFDVVLWANAVYYVPPDDRVAVLRTIGRLLSDRGVLVVVTTPAGPHPFSRHLDLVLRAQESPMQLPDVDDLADQLRQAGLRPEPPRHLMPGVPLVGVVARR